ncbi:MAG TPA: V-type ATP synthase subunit D [Planctomycetota bacterium]|nr:V-type ATP synthase subunit D [Planctomycetota bacterium]
MAKLNVPPTKSSQLEISRSLEFAREGSDLLEQKRQILVIELMSRIDAAKRLQAEVDQKLEEAYAALRRAVLTVGSEALARGALAVALQHKLTIESHPLMGLRIPKIETQHERPGLEFGMLGSTAASDQVLKRFNEALDTIGRLAEVQTVVFRVARELKKTQRRVNALEKIFLPDYEETLAYIAGTLEERERESFIVMKMLKKRKE